IHTGVNFRTEGVFTPFSLSGVSVPEGEYNHQELQFVLQTNANEAVYFYNRSVIGGYYGGDRIQLRNSLNIRVGDKFIAALNMDYNKLKLPNGDINAIISSTRLTYSFNPKMFLQSLIQYNNVTNITSVNARFGLLQTANAGLFVVLNIVRDTDFDDPLNNQVFSVKYSYQFDLL
ncbi:hydrolase, partial [Flavobacteriaceae bacterium]|nr:hydrolase [Flavobacteriaceae bacterium]